MKKPNDSMWERDPDRAHRVVCDSINQDLENGYITRREAKAFRKMADKLRDKGKRASRA